ncbi:MAG: peptide MFS transporter [Bacteroidia bacterium]|nr:peptide MFS transporter [Bacteroidia bacterium]
MSATPAAPKGRHPKGLYMLFFTEMWERFGYYLILGILYLYMTDSLIPSAGENSSQTGLGLQEEIANDIYGTFLALVYLTPFIGGLLADRIMGYRRTIVIGGVLMGIGYLTMAIPGQTAFFVALALIIIGNGFFKPNISTLLGNLYNKEEYVQLKDQGYNIFYMGINVGAFICNFVAAWLRNTYGWGWAFAAAGIGMFIGVIIFVVNQRRVAEVDIVKGTKPEDMPLSQIFLTIFLPAIIAAAVGYFIPGSVFGSDTTDAFLFACIPVTYFYLRTYLKASPEDKKPVGTLLYVFVVVIIFWAIFHQNGNVLTAWAENYTNRTVSVIEGGSADNLGFFQDVAAPAPGQQPHGYLENLPRESWPAEGQQLRLVSTELFQSLNPFFVVTFTFLIVGFFTWLRRRNQEPSTPGKIAWGLFITGLSTLVMVGAVYVSSNGAQKVSPMWLVGTYAVISIGELFLSPMGLSLVSKLSPARLTALMMGGWFLSTSIGNKMSGVLGVISTLENKYLVFLINFAGATLAAVLLFIMVKQFRQVVREKTGHD